MKKEIETQRYLLRIPKMEDAEEIYEKWGNDEEKVAEYKCHNTYKNVIQTRALLRAVIAEAEEGMPLWFIESKESTEMVSSVLEKLGMKREGVLRNRMINNNGEKINKIIYSILKEEWEN